MKRARLMCLVMAMMTVGVGRVYAADIKISGYIQAQCVIAGKDVKDISNDPIHICRASIKVKAKAKDSVGCITVDGGKDKISLSAYLEHTLNINNGVKVQMGQITLPVSYSLLESSSKRELPERPLVIRKLYEGDTGITISGKLAKVDYTIGAFNGVKDWKDDNDKKDIAARLTGAIKDLHLGVSAYRGESGTGAAAWKKERTGFELRYSFPFKTVLTAELITGKEKLKDVDGWYMLVTHPLAEKLIGAVRYDTYDPDRDTLKDATNTVGGALVYQLDDAMRVTLAYVDPKEEGIDKDNSEATLRLQFKY